MKKTAAIVFLFVFLFNLYGYRLLIDGIQKGKETAQLEQLDNERYAEEDLISFKTPVALPYYTNSETYDRVDGTIEIDGTEYQYVKRRIFNDSLELLCLPNKVKQQLDAAKDDFFKRTTEGTTPDGKMGTTKAFKNILLEYCNNLQPYTLNPLKSNLQHQIVGPDFHLPALNPLLRDQPPELG